MNNNNDSNNIDKILRRELKYKYLNSVQAGLKGYNKTFQDLKRAYMKKHQYGNTKTVDLWNAWGEASGKDIKGLMAAWTEQMGFPLVTVESLTPNGNGKATLNLHQQWFLADGRGKNEDASKIWQVPMFVTVGGKKLPMTFFYDKSGSIEIGYNEGDWVKVNAGHTVPLRVLYPSNMLSSLVGAMHKRELGEIDRAGLLSDCYALVKAGDLGIDELCKLIAACKGDASYIVMDIIEPILGGLHKVFVGQAEDGDSSTLDAYEKFAREFVAPVFELVGWDIKATDEHLSRFLRSVMVRATAAFNSNDQAVLKEARRRFDAWKADKKTPLLPEDYQSAVRENMFKYLIIIINI